MAQPPVSTNQAPLQSLHCQTPTWTALLQRVSRSSHGLAVRCSKGVSLLWAIRSPVLACAHHSSGSMESQEFSAKDAFTGGSTRLLELTHYGTMMANMVWYLCMVDTACTELFPIYRTYSLEAGHTCIH